MTTIKVEKLNEVYLYVYSSDMGVESELSDYFTYEYPGAKFTPKYRAKLWDGKVYLYSAIRKTLYCGLYDYLVKFCEANGYELEHVNEVISTTEIEYDQVDEFAQSLALHARGVPIDIRDYQLDAIHTGLRDHRGVLLSPTGSGKSLIIYTMCRWHLEEGRKVIVVVPSTALVEQMYADFEDYSTHNQWDVEHHCQKLYSGFTKEFTSGILFTTWQSVWQLPGAWFNQFDVIIGDEAHQFKAKSLTTIMEKLTHVKHRIGTTGSLDDKKVNRLVLEGIFGRVYRVTTTKRLQDEGRLAGLQITSLLLKHPEDVRKAHSKMEYDVEVDYIVGCEKRNKFIRNLSLTCKGNTLVLFQFVEKHGEPLYEMIKSKAGDRPVYIIHGGVNVKEREAIRRKLATESNAIVVSSYGTMSTGINIPSIENIIFASPSKSVIRVLQSVGRGLRLNTGKSHCNLYDLTDDLHWKGWKNHTLKHGADRYKIYAGEQFTVKLTEINL